MIPNTAINRYRPTKVSDGVGGSTVVLGTPVVMYGALKVDGNEVILTLPSAEDVLINDVFSVKEN